MHYITVTTHQIEDLRSTISLFDQVWGEELDEHALWLYGMVKDEPSILGVMADAIEEQVDNQQSVTVSSGVVVIPLSADTLYYLTGSGMILKEESFAYVSDKEIRTGSFRWATQDTLATLASFSKLALSSSDVYAEDFLKWEGVEALTRGETPRPEEAKVERTEPPKGGLVEEGGTTAIKSSSLTQTEPEVWSEENFNNMSMETLFALRDKLERTDSTNDDSFFVIYEASVVSGYLLKVSSAEEGFFYISKKLGLEESDIEEEAMVLTGLDLLDVIEAQLGE